MAQELSVHLTWEGNETVKTIARLAREPQPGVVTLALPRNYHHAIYQHLYPGAGAGEVETLNEAAGPELLARIARVRGLENLEELVGPLQARNASANLSDPAILTIVLR